MAATTQSNFTFNPSELSQTFQKYRQELYVVQMMAMSQLLNHVSTRTGIRYRETIGSLSGDFQMGNYKKDKKGTGAVSIDGRVFETFFGNCIEPIDPNAIVHSIWGSNVTKGDDLKKVPIVLQVASYIMKVIGENLVNNSFTAAHDGTDFTSTAKFFNGFKTIIEKDIAGTNVMGRVLISEDLNNLQYGDAITVENAEDVIKDFFWSRHSILRGQQAKLFISDMTYHMYTEAYQAAHGALPYNQSYDKRTLEGASNVEIVPLPFVPDDFMLLTPKKNIFALFNQKTDDEKFLVEKSLTSHYEVDFIANMFFGVQFGSVNERDFSVYMKKSDTADQSGTESEGT